MNSTISLDDKKAMCDFIMNNDYFTNGKKVKEFEREWSKWQGCKHSVFVNSGSSANLVLVSAMKHLYGTGSSVAQSVTWSTNISPLMQLGYNLQLCDADLKNLGPDIDSLERILKSGSYKIMFLTHVLGFNALSRDLLDLLEKHDVILLEDCCESTGTTFEGKKVGTFGKGSTFSFYYGHHMTTIEGGMICTDDDELYNVLRMMRSHGLSKEGVNMPEVEGVDPLFTFMVPGYNVRNTEIHAELGLRKLRELDNTISIRNKNMNTFLKFLDKNKFITNFDTEGMSNFSFPIICLEEKNKEKVRDCLDKMGIENRPIISGSLYRQPFMKNVNQLRYDKNAEVIHLNGLYVGNHTEVSEDMIEKMCIEINKV